jgi:hypothetical protein
MKRVFRLKIANFHPHLYLWYDPAKIPLAN